MVAIGIVKLNHFQGISADNVEHLLSLCLALNAVPLSGLIELVLSAEEEGYSKQMLIAKRVPLKHSYYFIIYR